MKCILVITLLIGGVLISLSSAHASVTYACYAKNEQGTEVYRVTYNPTKPIARIVGPTESFNYRAIPTFDGAIRLARAYEPSEDVSMRILTIFTLNTTTMEFVFGSVQNDIVIEVSTGSCISTSFSPIFTL